MSWVVSDWVVSELEPGDDVVVSNMQVSRVAKVERVTKTLVILQDGARFNRRTGHSSSRRDRWYYESLFEATPQQVESIRAHEHRRELILSIRAFHEGLKEAPTELLEQVAGVITSYEEV